jgi:outer membrane protein assembly factor BamE (lipoprotein component of BamABCDE complex)
MKKLFLSLIAVLALAACAPTTSTNGVFLSQDDVAKVTPGTSTRTEVLQALGTPTTTAVFDDNVWYYVGLQTEKKAFFDPKVTARKVYEAQFTPEGTLASLQEIDAEAINVPITRRKTPTSGHDLTIAQQLLGNLGRFNKQGAAPGSTVMSGPGL